MNSILIGPYEFEFPLSGDQLECESGVYAVLHEEKGEFELVDLEQADNLQDRWLSVRSRYDSTRYPVKLFLAVYYMPGRTHSDRQSVVSQIEREFDRLAVAS